jgi:hypothetical protein
MAACGSPFFVFVLHTNQIDIVFATDTSSTLTLIHYKPILCFTSLILRWKN